MTNKKKVYSWDFSAIHRYFDVLFSIKQLCVTFVSSREPARYTVCVPHYHVSRIKIFVRLERKSKLQSVTPVVLIWKGGGLVKCLGVSCKMRTRGVVCVMDSDNAAFQICW